MNNTKIIELEKSLKNEFLTLKEKTEIRSKIKRIKDELCIRGMDKTLKNFAKQCKKEIHN